MLKKLKSLVKTILANRACRVALNASNKAFLSIASSSRITSTLWSWVNILPFSREQYAVLSGRAAYYKNLTQTKQSRVQLRRNIHRLEKALLMQPRREVFALDYIQETLDFYSDAVHQHTREPEIFDESELLWAHDVLGEFFDAVVSTPFLDAQKARFKNCAFSPTEHIRHKVPYARQNLDTCPVSYEALSELALRRRSVRWFEQRSVPRELIDKAMLIARQAPSACNRLPYEFRFYDEPELVKKIADIPFGTAGYSQNIPTIAVVTGKLDSYFSPRDRHIIYIDSSLAAMSFAFALETLGLASGMINWPDFEPLEMKMQKTLGLKVYERPIMLIAIGYPDKNALVAYSQKKDLEVIRSFNKI